MTADQRYTVAFYEYVPSRHPEEPPEWIERPDLDYTTDDLSSIRDVVDVTASEEYPRLLSYEIIDDVTERRFSTVREAMEAGDDDS